MGIDVTIARAIKVAGAYKPETADEPSQTVKMTRDEALSLFTEMVSDLGSNILLRIVTLSETSISFFYEYHFEQFDSRHRLSYEAQGEDVQDWYGFLYTFEVENDAQFNDWDAFLTVVYPFVVFYPRLCEPAVLEFIERMKSVPA